MTASSFWLAPDALEHQAIPFDDYAAQAQSAKQYLAAHPFDDTGDHPAYRFAAERARELRSSLIDWFDHLASVLTGVAVELRSVADEKRSIDAEEAARIDASDPSVYNGNSSSASEVVSDSAGGRSTDLMPVWGPPAGGAARFCDFGPAYDHLNDLTLNLVPGDLLSPVEWIDTILGWLGATPLPETVMREFGGRWGDLRAFADTLTGLSQLIDDMRGHLGSAASFIKVAWQGYAASSAQDYFDRLSAVLGNAVQEFQDAGDAFASYADGVEGTAEAVSSALYGLLDSILIAAVAAGLGTATIETVVGGILGWGAAGVALLNAGRLVAEVNDQLQFLNDLGNILGSISNLSSDLSDFSSELPVPAMEVTN